MNRIRGIKAVSFDVDGTLWDFDKVMRHSLHRASRELERVDAESAAMINIEKRVAIRPTAFDEQRYPGGAARGSLTNVA